MREFWMESDGARLWSAEEGDGPVILMLHGAMANHLAARPLVVPAADRCRVVTPDVRGSGKSWYGGPLSFDQLVNDLERLLDHIGAGRAVIGGVSSGSGVALRFALRQPGRTAGLVLVKPMYAGAARGYTEQQQETLARMDALASRATAEGVQVLRPLYAGLPDGVRERALAMIEAFDPASVATTSRFMASGAQPFESSADLNRLTIPTLLVRGDDPMHPAAVSDLYSAAIPNCTPVAANAADVGQAIRTFVDGLHDMC